MTRYGASRQRIAKLMRGIRPVTHCLGCRHARGLAPDVVGREAEASTRAFLAGEPAPTITTRDVICPGPHCSCCPRVDRAGLVSRLVAYLDGLVDEPTEEPESH